MQIPFICGLKDLDKPQYNDIKPVPICKNHYTVEYDDCIYDILTDDDGTFLDEIGNKRSFIDLHPLAAAIQTNYIKAYTEGWFKDGNKVTSGWK